MDDDLKVDPDTCSHKILRAWIGRGLRLWAVCVKCETDMSDTRLRVGRNYIYNPQHDLWVNTKKEPS